MLKNVTLCLLGLLAFTSVAAQQYSGEAAAQLVKGADKVYLDPATKHPEYIRIKASEHVVEATFLHWLRQALKMPAATEFRKVSSLTDDIGYEHIRYQQYHYNIAVAGGEYLAHVRGGKVESCNGAYINMGTKTAAVSLNKNQALQRALEHVNARRYMWQDPAEEQLLKAMTNNPKATYYPEGELVFAPVSGNLLTDTYVAAFKFDVYASAPLERSWVFVHAANGNLLFKLDQIHTADSVGNAHTRYNGVKNIRTTYANGQYRLQSVDLGVNIHTRNLNKTTTYNGATEFTNPTKIWNPSTLIDKASLDAHYGSQSTYEYFLTKHNRNSFNGTGAPMFSFVHYDNAYNNAFWDGQRMTYGDGDGSYFTPLTSIDIVGHEFSHGVTSNSAQLVYRNESGALNESFSDIFGTAIEFYNNPSTANYMIGELIMPGGGALRNMANPNQFGDPDTYNGKHWKPLNGPDNGGVHSNSGVQNFWYYLLSEGGQGTNDIGNDYKVQGIGREKAERIAYRNLTTKLTSSSTYAVAASMAVLAAEELFGVCSDEAKATKDAWYAVGIGTPASITASFGADKVFSCQAPATITFQNKSNNATSYVWDFGDNSPVSTAATPTHTYTAPGTYTVKLKAISGTPICGVTQDSVLKTAYIEIANTGGPIAMAASCQPAATSPMANFGIKRVMFNTIDKSSGNATEGYKDFTCETNTQLTAGNIYDMTIFTGPPPAQMAKVWIDYNNDGAFDPVTELAAASGSVFINSTNFNIRTPATATLNTPVRMRVSIDNPYNPLTTCGTIHNGQAEDYTVTFVANSSAPVVDFEASTRTPQVGQQVTFTDLSNNSPTSWKWLLPGSSQPTSLLQNPVVTYATPGLYDVTLIGTNAFGTDTLTRTVHINVMLATGTAEEVALQKNLNVFPNPASGMVNIDYGFDGRKDISVSMTNVLGQQVYTHSATATDSFRSKVDVRNQSAGIYFITVSDGTNRVTRKVIVQH